MIPGNGVTVPVVVTSTRRVAKASPVVRSDPTAARVEDAVPPGKFSEYSK